MFARYRWLFLLSSLAATIAAIIYPIAPEVDTFEPLTVPKAMSASKNVAQGTSVDVEDELGNKNDDPFSPRGWSATPVPVVVNQVVKTVVAETAPAPQAPVDPPPLPYRFLGKLTDEGNVVVYLGRGEQTHIAKVGEVIESVYKVIKITDQSVELEHLPTGEKQYLSIE
ncbi:hypothetical protein H8K52_18060 [Undibacterium seohonense]|uniref:Uncharacterized protein n=1 Tax=Undibacterium seohonense TaxID=1344950 RepID=A0ABR6X948_9BURK|nr:hypothetical protein [Undibacterium seohonense]MBC3809248.1 hypothetical protein [Undibacterium seohonense]